MDNKHHRIQKNQTMQSITNIQTFIEVARTGSFAQAGRRLSIPRATVSARVKTLEEGLNVRLLHRTTRQVSLTNEGQLYLERCEDALENLHAAEAELTTEDNVSGLIRLTVPVDIEKQKLAASLLTFRDLNPEARFEVIVTDAPLNLIEDNIDIALRGRSPGGDSLIARRLGEGRVGLFASKAYLDAHHYDDKHHSLSGHVVLDPGHLAHKQILKGTLPSAIKTDHFELAKSLAMRAHGIAVLPCNICEETVRNEELIELSHSFNLPGLPLYIVLPSRKYMPTRVRRFIDFLTCQKHPGSELIKQ